MNTLIRVLLAPFNWAGERLANAALGSFNFAGPTGHTNTLGSHQRSYQADSDVAEPLWSVQEHGTATSDSEQAAHSASAETALWQQHSMNVDGTPMFGSVDLNGNPFGVYD